MISHKEAACLRFCHKIDPYVSLWFIKMLWMNLSYDWIVKLNGNITDTKDKPTDVHIATSRIQSAKTPYSSVDKKEFS